MGSIRKHKKLHSRDDTVAFDHWLHVGRWDFYGIARLDGDGVYDIEAGLTFKDPDDFWVAYESHDFDGPDII